MNRRTTGYAPVAHTSTQRRRYQPTALYILAKRLKERGVRLWVMKGPWRATTRPLSNQGHLEPDEVPVVTNGRAEVMVDTMEHAADVSGFLNWAGVHDLTPVPELSPSGHSSAAEASELSPGEQSSGTKE